MHKSSLSSLGLSGNISTALFTPVIPDTPHTDPFLHRTKISIVNMTMAQTILTLDLNDDLALVDINPDKLKGEMLDIHHTATFLQRSNILTSADYNVTKGLDIVIITIGDRQIAGETRLDMLQRNVVILRSIVPEAKTR